jgi:hypothetical protein
MAHDSSQPTSISNESSSEFIRMYYEHQYDRMAKLEEQGHSITNIILSLSILAFTFGFDPSQKLNLVTGFVLPIIIISVNWFAALYLEEMRTLVRMHGRRAKETLRKYAPTLYNIDTENPEHPFRISRSQIHKLLHYLLILGALVPMILYALSLG